jgi:hypothetical protein
LSMSDVKKETLAPEESNEPGAKKQKLAPEESNEPGAKMQKLAPEEYNESAAPDERASVADPAAEIETLIDHCSSHKEPGVWAFAIGRASVVSMVSYSSSMVWNPSQDSIDWASRYASLQRCALGDVDKINWVITKARSVDNWNRHHASGDFLQAGLSAAAGFTKLVYSDSRADDVTDSNRKLLNWSSKKAGKRKKLRATVDATFAAASGIDPDALEDMAVKGLALERMIPALQKDCPSLSPARSLFKIVVIDARKVMPHTEVHYPTTEPGMPDLPSPF